MRKMFLVAAALGVFVAQTALAYDANFNFSHSAPEVVAGFRIKIGPTKGGPYPTVIQCGKPAAKKDGTYDCVGKGLTLDPLYAVAVAYDAANQESAHSNEASYDPPPPAPGGLKYTITGTVMLTPASP